MKKLFAITMALLLAVSLFIGCAQQPAPAAEAPTTAAPSTEASSSETPAEWSREGYYQDENENFLSITWLDDPAYEHEPGWYVGLMLGEDMYGNYVEAEGGTLHGNIVPDYEEGEFIVTVSEEGEDGVLLTVDGGESYHFKAMDIPKASIFVHISTEGNGMIAYNEGEEVPEIDPEYPYQSAQVNLAEPAVYTLAAQAAEDWYFVKWMKDGADYSTEPVITLELSESTDFVAVFEFEDGQDEMEYLSPDGWSVRYDPTLVESIEGDGFVDFVYLEAPENKATITFVEGKQPEELLYEVCEAWECDAEQINRIEGFFPGTEDMWGYWRIMDPQEDGLSRTAIAGEYNGGVLLIENVIRVTGDEETDYRITGALEWIVDSIRYDHFDPQTMYSYIPGIYSAEQDGSVYSVELREDHTGTLHFQDDVEFIWSSIELIGDDFRYEYTIEGESLLLNYDGTWMQFDQQ